MFKNDRYLEKLCSALFTAGVCWLVFTVLSPQLSDAQKEVFTFGTPPSTARLVPPTVDEQIKAGAPTWTAREYQLLYGPKRGFATRADIELCFGRNHVPTLEEYREVFGDPRQTCTLPVSRDPWTADVYDGAHNSHTLEEDLATVARRLRASKERSNAPPPHQ